MTSRARLASYRAEVIDPRLQLARQLPSAGYALAVTAAAVNVLVGLLPVALAVVTSALIGDVPAAIEGGTASDAWRGLVSTFLFATVLSFALQAATPVQSSLGQFVTHRVNGRYFDRVLEVSLRSTGIGPLENEANLGHLHDARLVSPTPEHPAMPQRRPYPSSRVTPGSRDSASSWPSRCPGGPDWRFSRRPCCSVTATAASFGST